MKAQAFTPAFLSVAAGMSDSSAAVIIGLVAYLAKKRDDRAHYTAAQWQAKQNSAREARAAQRRQVRERRLEMAYTVETCQPRLTPPPAGWKPNPKTLAKLNADAKRTRARGR